MILFATSFTLNGLCVVTCVWCIVAFGHLTRDIRQNKHKRRKRGPLSHVEKTLVDAAITDRGRLNTLSTKQVEAVATILERPLPTVHSVIAKARETFQRNAQRYVDAHAETLNSHDHDVRRKSAQWAIEHLSSRDAQGHVERIVEVVESASAGVKVQIGVQLGGLPCRNEHLSTPPHDTEPTIDGGDVE